MDWLPLLLEFNDFTWETRTGGVGGGEMSGGPGGARVAAQNWAKLGKRGLAGGDRCCAFKQDLAGF